MNNDIEVVIFDLFFTLVTPKYNDLKNENDVLSITREEWEKYAEDNELYLKRATGDEKSPQKIIDSIIDKIKINVNDADKKEILKLREERFKKSLIDVELSIINVLLDLKNSGKKLCLLSNADVIDVMHWDKSPLNELIDETIFSYEVGYLKPQTEIYELTLKKMKVDAKKCIYIGDGGSNELKGAKELGIKTILTSYLIKRESKEHNKIKEFADYYIEDFKDIKKIIL